MTSRQRTILMIGAATLLLSCLFVPWYAEDDGGYLDFGYAFFFSAEAVYLDLHRVVVEWVGIAAATGLAWLVARPVDSGPYRRRYGQDARPEP